MRGEIVLQIGPKPCKRGNFKLFLRLVKKKVSSVGWLVLAKQRAGALLEPSAPEKTEIFRREQKSPNTSRGGVGIAARAGRGALGVF